MPEDALWYPAAAHPSPPRLQPETRKIISGIEKHGHATLYLKVGWETPASEEEDGDRPWLIPWEGGLWFVVAPCG